MIYKVDAETLRCYPGDGERAAGPESQVEEVKRADEVITRRLSPCTIRAWRLAVELTETDLSTGEDA